MLSCQKEKFNLPEHITYLNCAYMGPTPRVAETAGIMALRQKSRPWEISISDFFEPGKLARELFSRLIHTSESNRIAVIPSVSYGMAIAVKNAKAKAGQNIVMLHEQFPSNYYSWKRLSEEKGVELRVVSPPDTFLDRGEKWNEKILEHIDSRTVVVALPHVHWADGTLFDLIAIRKKCNEVGAKMIIDGTQSVGALPFDVSLYQPDALICGAYKWLFGAYSSGLAYFAEGFDGGIPLEENWINRLGSENFENLVNYQPLYQPAAQRYNMGERSQFIALAILNESLQLLLDWSPESIQEYCAHISDDCLSNLEELGFWMENRKWRGSHLVGLRMPQNADLIKMKRLAKQEDVHVSFRGNAMRIAPHVYNQKQDLKKLEMVLRAAL